MSTPEYHRVRLSKRPLCRGSIQAVWVAEAHGATGEGRTPHEAVGALVFQAALMCGLAPPGAWIWPDDERAHR